MITALLLSSLRWFLVGACWTGGGAGLRANAKAVAISLPISLALTLLLAALDLYRVPLELGFLLVIAVVGAIRTRPNWRYLMPGLLVLNLLVACVMLLPNRMEWISGGWDPGTYVCEGVSLAHEGGWTREPERFLQFLGDEERALFTRDRYNFLEAMPVTPLDAETKATKPFFFPLYSALIASSYTAGGLTLATRCNIVLGGLALFLFGAALSRYGRPFGIFGMVLLAAQPLFIYHLNFPTSEVLHLYLIAAILFWFVRSESKAPDRWTVVWLALLFFLGPLNRLDFLLFGAALLVVRALLDADRELETRQTKGWAELLILGGSLLAGAGAAIFLADAAVDRLGKDVPMLVMGSLVLLAGAGVIRLVGAPLRRALRGLWDWVADHVHWGVAAVMLLGFAAVWYVQAPKTDQPMIWQLKGMWWYITWPSALLAMLGFFCLEWKRLPGALGAWIIALVGMVILVVVFGKIHQTWPWAARRYVPTVLPVLAVLGAWGAVRTSWTGTALVLLVCVFNAPRAKMAWDVMQDDAGLSSQLAMVAQQLEPNDLLVCDHFVWAVPLRFLHDVQVVNGEQFYEDARKFPDQRAALDAWPGRVVWLTSTDKGLSVFPGDLSGLKNVWQADAPFEYRKVRRARYVGGFTDEERERYKDVLGFFVRGFEQVSNQKRFALWSKGEKPFPKAGPGDVYINVGDESADPFLRSADNEVLHGWSRPEGYRDAGGAWHDAQWIKRLEADVQFRVSAPEDMDFYIRAMPMYDERLRQNVGLYVNGTFVDEWLCPSANIYEVCTTRIPANLLQAGENRLSLRVGHLAKGPGRDSRKLGLLVDKILLRPRP